MGKKIVNRLLMLLAILFIAVYLTGTTSLATGFLNPGSIKPNNNGNLASTTQGIAGSILAVAQVIGIAVAVIMLIVLAIKYMTSAPNDKAEIKKHAVVYIVGAVILFAASGILGIIRGFAEQLGGKTVTDSLGVVTTYDSNGNVTKRTKPDGSYETYEYNGSTVTIKQYAENGQKINERTEGK